MSTGNQTKRCLLFARVSSHAIPVEQTRRHTARFCFANDEDYRRLISVRFNYVSPSTGSLAEAYNNSVGTMDFCQALAVLEAVNPLLGIGKSSFTTEMLQVKR